jgi:hypothetical protein
MDKRYQVFVSSTFADLQEERRHVIQTLMEMDCIPSGMELFPAMDEEQFEFIKKVIDDCDYYILIIGGRYGSTTSEGISYTEKEYDYAIEKGIKVIALLHEKPDEITKAKSENDPKLVKKLTAFRKKVSTNRLVKFWKSADELAGLVALSLQKTIKMFPAVGWIRASQSSNTALLNDLNELRKKKDELEDELAKLREIPAIEIPNLASLDEKIKVFGKCKTPEGWENWQFSPTWEEVFGLVSPYLTTMLDNETVKDTLGKSLFDLSQESGYSAYLNERVFQTIKIQLQALNLVKVQHLETTDGKMALFWSLTKTGYAQMMSIRTVKSRVILT